jgi:hypothetical protein
VGSVDGGCETGRGWHTTPRPVTERVEGTLLEAVSPDGEELLLLLPHAAVDLQDEVQGARRPPLTRVWGCPGRRGSAWWRRPGGSD